MMCLQSLLCTLLRTQTLNPFTLIGPPLLFPKVTPVYSFYCEPFTLNKFLFLFGIEGFTICLSNMLIFLSNLIRILLCSWRLRRTPHWFRILYVADWFPVLLVEIWILNVVVLEKEFRLYEVFVAAVLIYEVYWVFVSFKGIYLKGWALMFHKHLFNISLKNLFFVPLGISSDFLFFVPKFFQLLEYFFPL